MTNLQIAHLNVRSLQPKLAEFKLLIFKEKYDVIALSETWLKPNTPDSHIKINGYKIVRVDRPTRGGGVAFYIRDNIKFDTLVVSIEIEQLFISININTQKYIIGVCYRPPQMNFKNFVDQLENSVSVAMSLADNIIILGDVNIDLLMDSPASAYLNLMMESLEMTQMVVSATHLNSKSSTLIDVIITNNPEMVSCGVKDNDLSDHELIFCSVQCIKPKVEPFLYTYRDYKKFDQKLFLEELKSQNINQIFYIMDVNDKISVLNSIIQKLLDKHLPVKTVKITRPKAPWLTENIKFMISQRDKYKTKARKTQSQDDLLKYRQLRNNVNHAILVEKRFYFSNISQKCNKVLWKELRSLQIKNCKPSIPLNLQNVNKINNFFIESIPKVNNNVDSALQFYRENSISKSVFSFQIVSEELLLETLMNIKNSSAGSDNISIEIFKICYPVLSKHILNIINSVFVTSKYPTVWKTALITPVPKVHKPECLSDLRPISILPGISKVMEKLMELQLKSYLEANNILPDVQSGFRAGFSSTTALLNITDDIIRAADSGHVTMMVLLDYSKAFDTLSHPLLLGILRSCGLAEESLLLLHSYLTDRCQKVRLNGSVSNARLIEMGVPQGSILGPLLFTVYTSQFVKSIEHCRIHMYADDTQVYYSFPENQYMYAENCINEDLNKLAFISLQHCLQLNEKKSTAILFGKQKSCEKLTEIINVAINQVKISPSNNVKNLGLYLDRTLRFREQVSKSIQKAYAALRLLYPHRSYLSISTKKKLCEVLVLSQFTYCSPVIGPCLDSDCTARIQRVQNACIRFIFGIRKYEHVSHKLSELNWLNMIDRRQLQMICLFHKIISDKCPPYLFRKITFRSDVHNINIRCKGLISPPPHKTSIFERSFSYNIYKMYNSIPNNIKSLGMHTFRKKMRDILRRR